MAIRMGFLISISSDPATEVSTSCTSPLILAIMSPFLSSEKNPRGRARILSYIFILRFLTIPVLIGIITADEPK